MPEVNKTRDGRAIRKFRGVDVALRYSTYQKNNRIAIQMMRVLNGKDSEPYTVVTVNLPNEAVAPDEVAIKDYAENDGILEWLVIEGIVSEPIWYGQSGYTQIPICKLLKKGERDA